MAKKRLSAMYCEHANEMPSGACPCPDNCYCRRKKGPCCASKAASRALKSSRRLGPGDARKKELEESSKEAIQEVIDVAQKKLAQVREPLAITVSGPPFSGKTTLVRMIEQLLVEKGLNSVVEQSKLKDCRRMPLGDCVRSLRELVKKTTPISIRIGGPELVFTDSPCRRGMHVFELLAGNSNRRCKFCSLEVPPPTYNHTREDSALLPCDLCKFRQTQEERARASKESLAIAEEMAKTTLASVVCTCGAVNGRPHYSTCPRGPSLVHHFKKPSCAPSDHSYSYIEAREAAWVCNICGDTRDKSELKSDRNALEVRLKSDSDYTYRDFC